MKIISASIDLSKIDKAKIQKLDKNGTPYVDGKMFYNVDIIVNDEPNQFGQDTSISTAQTKEERLEKAKRNYIGNGKTVWNGGGYKPNEPSQVKITHEPALSETKYAVKDDLPF